jgi:multiple antibiotic resistance protein
MLDLFIKDFVSFFVMANPVGVSMIFIGLVAYAEPEEIKATARKSVLVAAGIALLFAFCGELILEKFGISLPAFRISGGVLLFSIASKKLFGDTLAEAHASDRQALADKEDITVFPLAIPLITGPGLITLVIILMSGAKDVAEKGIVLTSMIAVLLLTWLSFRAARRIRMVLGSSGVNLVTRIMGLLLAARAVQIIADGIQGFHFNFMG